MKGGNSGRRDLSSDDAMTGTSAFHHRVSFTLPAPNDTVFVDLGFIGI